MSRRYSAERRRCSGGPHYEAIDSTGRFATPEQAAQVAFEKWGLDRRGGAMSLDLALGSETVEVYDWETHTYVGHATMILAD